MIPTPLIRSSASPNRTRAASSRATISGVAPFLRPEDSRGAVFACHGIIDIAGNFEHAFTQPGVERAGVDGRKRL
jgi:cytochrome c peroxidase